MDALSYIVDPSEQRCRLPAETARGRQERRTVSQQKAVGARNPVAAGQAAIQYSLMRPRQRIVRTIRSCCPVALVW